MTTFILVAALAFLLVGSLILWAWLLSVGLHWVNARNITRRKLALTTLLTSCANLAFSIAGAIPTGIEPVVHLLLLVVACMLNLLFVFWLIMLVFNVSVIHAVKAWLPTLAGPVILLVWTSFVVRPFVVEAFKIPTNSMAPTIIGLHLENICPECESPAFTSPPYDLYYSDSLSVGPWICQDNFHATQIATTSDTVHGSDRILVAKYLKPRRWDLVVFKNPEDPSQLYVKRLVGLPGETITIENGEVFANDKRIEKPESIRGIYYESEMDYQRIWGSVGQPAILGDDEYFVLGDFSKRAKDSRMWYDGAPGHPPYAVPASYMKGVATHIYWPVHRWRIFR